MKIGRLRGTKDFPTRDSKRDVVRQAAAFYVLTDDTLTPFCFLKRSPTPPPISNAICMGRLLEDLNEEVKISST